MDGQSKGRQNSLTLVDADLKLKDKRFDSNNKDEGNMPGAFARKRWKSLSVMMNRKKDLQREELSECRDMATEKPDLTLSSTDAVLLAALSKRCDKAKAQNLSTWLTKSLAIVCLTK